MTELDIRPGVFLKHFKHDLVRKEDQERHQYIYQVLHVARHTETDEVLVIYQALYHPFKIWARPIKMFCQPVDKTKYPLAMQTTRFEVIGVCGHADNLGG